MTVPDINFIDSQLNMVVRRLGVLEEKVKKIESPDAVETAKTRPMRLFTFQPHEDGQESLNAHGGIGGICPVCGNLALFQGFTSNLRESGSCSSCGSFNRQRQIAYMVRQCFQLAPNGPLELPAGIIVYNTETTGAVNSVLSSLENYINSEYFGPEHTPGQIVDGRRHEDIQNLSFDSNSIDLILSSDVLEHMPSPYLAHQEIFRVLKPGGRHIFTVPFSHEAARDDIRAELINGEIRYLSEKLFHGDPVRPAEGILVWTIFGVEMLLKLRDLGFAVEAWDVYNADAGIVGNLPIVFEAQKPVVRT